MQPLPLPQDLLTSIRTRTSTRAARRERATRDVGAWPPALLAALLAAALAGLPSGPGRVHAQEPEFPSIEIVVDASGSMRSRMGDADRMSVAREFVRVLRTALEEEGVDPTLAVRAYGSASHRLRRDCTDTRLLAELGAGPEAATAAVAGLQPLGVSPLAYALERAAEDSAGTYVLVTDGGDNCGGDPCRAWRDAIGRAGDNRALRLHVVAIEPEPAVVERLLCLSRAGSGAFVRVDAAREVEPAARRMALVLADRGRIDVRLSVGGGEAFFAPVRLLRPLTGEVVAAFPGRRPRSVPAGVYTLTIETAPPIRVERAMILPGETVRVERSDFGRLVVELEGDGADARAPVSIRPAGERVELRYVRTGDVTTLGAGAYDVQVDLGDSLVVREGLEVAEGLTTRFVVGSEEPGALRVVAPGFESPPPVRALAYGEGGVDTLAVGTAGSLAPGRYRLVVQTLPPYVTENVVVDPGRETIVALPETGVLGIDLTGAEGPIEGARVEIQEPMTGEPYGAIPSGERRLVMPGTYRLTVRAAPPIVIDGVVVDPGATRIVERGDLSRIVVEPGVPAGTPPLRLEVLALQDGRRLAESTGASPWVTARPGTYRARLRREGTVVWEGRVTVAPEKTARIDWVGP